MPIGNIGDTATATPVATITPPRAISSTRSPTVAMRCRRVRPSAANVGWSMSACETSREHDRDRDRAGKRSNSREDPQRERQHVDRILAAVRFGGDILHRRELRSEHLASRRSHARDVGGAVARAYPQDRREDRDATLVRAIEGGGLDDDAARSREIAEVERPPDNADDPQPHGGPAGRPGLLPRLTNAN